jgi:hypothetical protein
VRDQDKSTSLGAFSLENETESLANQWDEVEYTEKLLDSFVGCLFLTIFAFASIDLSVGSFLPIPCSVMESIYIVVGFEKLKKV